MASCEGLGWGGGTTGGGVMGGGGGSFGATLGLFGVGWGGMHCTTLLHPPRLGGTNANPPPFPMCHNGCGVSTGLSGVPCHPMGAVTPPAPPPPPLRENSHLFSFFFPLFFLQPFFFSSFYGKLRFTSLTFNGGSDLPSGTAGNGDIYWGRGGGAGRFTPIAQRPDGSGCPSVRPSVCLSGGAT